MHPTMSAEIGAAPNSYKQQLQAMSMCWPGFDSVGSYGPSPSYPCQPSTCPTLTVPIATKTDQQIVNQFHPHNFASFAQQLTTLSLNTSKYPVCATPPGPTKKKPVPVPENLKDNAYRERRMKNNESARKSRELRRQKEESTQRRCDQLLHENHLLRTELSLLRSQVEQFRQIMSYPTNTTPRAFVTATSTSNS